MWPGARDLVYPVIAPHVIEDLVLVIDLRVDLDVGGGAVAAGASEPDIRVAVAGGERHLFDCGAQLVFGAVVAGSQLLDGAIDIGLTPEQGGAIVEQVEVMLVVAFLPDDLERDVLVVDSIIEGWGSLVLKDGLRNR